MIVLYAEDLVDFDVLAKVDAEWKGYNDSATTVRKRIVEDTGCDRHDCQLRKGRYRTRAQIFQDFQVYDKIAIRLPFKRSNSNPEAIHFGANLKIRCTG